MSFKALEWVESVKGLHPVERVILYYLAKRANNKNQCWPAIARIARDCEIGRTSVYRAIGRMEEEHLLRLDPRKLKSGRDTSSVFTLKLHRGVSHDGTTQSHDGTHGSHGGTPIPESSVNLHLNLKTAGDQTVPATESQILEIPEIEQDQFLVSKELDLKKLDDILQLHATSLTPAQAIINAKKGRNSYTSLRLQLLWRDLVAYYSPPGMFQKSLTKKAAGQLTYITKQFVGYDPDFGWILNTVVAGWVGFGKFLKEQGIVHDFPDKPDPGFLLKHLTLAVEFGGKTHQTVGSDGAKPFDPNEFCN